MDTELGQEQEREIVERDDVAEDGDWETDESGGMGAAIAMLIALSAFLLAVVLVILRHVLFHA